MIQWSLVHIQMQRVLELTLRGDELSKLRVRTPVSFPSLLPRCVGLKQISQIW